MSLAPALRESTPASSSNQRDSSVYYHEGYLSSAARLEPDGRLEIFRHGSAVVPLIVRPLPPHVATGFDVISPYDFSGPLVGRESPRDVWRQLKEWARAHEVVTGFFRFHPFLRDAPVSKSRDVILQRRRAAGVGPHGATETGMSRDYAPLYGSIDGLEIEHVADNIVVDLADPNAMLATFKPRVKRDLKVAGRCRVTCRVDLVTPDSLDVFVPMYWASLQRLGADAYYRFPRLFFDRLAERLPRHVLVARAGMGREVVASALLLLDGAWAYYYLACSTDTGRKVCAMNALVFECARYLRTLGLSRFHLGGGAGGLRHFKERFGPGRVPYHVGRAVFDRDRYAALCRNLSTSYFPAYRAPQTR